MSGNNSDDESNDKVVRRDSSSSIFSDDDTLVYDPITKQYVTVDLAELHAPVVFSDLYNKARVPQEAAEQSLRDAIKAKVDDIIILLQEHASKNS